MTRQRTAAGGQVKRAGRPFAGVRDAKRRVSGPLDTSRFAAPRLQWAPSPHSSELSRLSSYRLGLSGTYGKYRVVPRSAIFAYDRLEATVREDSGQDSLRSVIERLWRDHGAPSRRVIDEFLLRAGEVDRRRLEDPEADLAPARRQVLEDWLRACRPPSVAERVRQDVELGFCFVMRRTRHYARAVAHKVSG